MKIKFLVLFCLLAQGVFSQNMRSASPESQGMSSDRLAWIDKMITEEIDNQDIPGAVGLIARNGQVIYHKAFGSRNAKGDDLEKDNIFRIASQTKAITSTAVMQLWEQGLFRLDDPISKWIPEFENPTVLDTLYEDGSYDTSPADKEITIRHLLTHTSGLGYGVIDGNPSMKKIYQDAGIIDLYTTQNITIGDNIKKLAKLPLHHNPGERFTYSEGLDVLGYFIEIVSGQPFDEYLREHIFDPLGMEDTWFYLPKKIQKRLVNIQHYKDGQWADFPVTFYDPDYPKKGEKSFFSGGAGLSSTPLDYFKFLQMHLNQGVYNGARILSRTTTELIQKNHFGLGDDFQGLAFGVRSEQGAKRGGEGSPGTFYWGGYFNTQYFVDPKEKIIGILMKQTQETSNDDSGWKFLQIAGACVID